MEIIYLLIPISLLLLGLIVWILLWALLRCRWIKFAPLVVFFPPVVFGVIVNLQARQMLPDWLQDNTFRHGEEM